jgi:membrane protein implicated in regulation of membrane protease activity
MTRGKLIRRLFGAACLIGAVVMLLAGETKSAAAGSQVGFILYWLACFLLAGLAMAAAILDLGAVRREARTEQRDLLQNTLRDIEAEKQRRVKAGENRDKGGLQH